MTRNDERERANAIVIAKLDEIQRAILPMREALAKRDVVLIGTYANIIKGHAVTIGKQCTSL